MCACVTYIVSWVGKESEIRLEHLCVCVSLYIRYSSWVDVKCVGDKLNLWRHLVSRNAMRELCGVMIMTASNDDDRAKYLTTRALNERVL